MSGGCQLLKTNTSQEEKNDFGAMPRESIHVRLLDVTDVIDTDEDPGVECIRTNRENPCRMQS